MQLATRREANLVGAWAQAAASAIEDAVDEVAGGTGALAAALVTVTLFPGERLDALRHVLGLSPSGAVRTVDHLVRRGLVERRRSEGDGREVLIHPTGQGRRLAESVLDARAAAVDRLLERLSAPERQQFLGVLEQLLSTLPIDRHDARRICRLCEHPACERSWCPVSQGAPGEGRRSHPPPSHEAEP